MVGNKKSNAFISRTTWRGSQKNNCDDGTRCLDKLLMCSNLVTSDWFSSFDLSCSVGWLLFQMRLMIIVVN